MNAPGTAPAQAPAGAKTTGGATPARKQAMDALWRRAMAWGAHFGCHQRPERSLFVGPYQLPVCARCFGFLLGSYTALPLAALGKARPVLGLFVLPMAIDGLRQRFWQHPSNNLRRYLSGWLAGLGFTAAGLALVWKIIKNKRRPHENPHL